MFELFSKPNPRTLAIFQVISCNKSWYLMRQITSYVNERNNFPHKPEYFGMEFWNNLEDFVKFFELFGK